MLDGLSITLGASTAENIWTSTEMLAALMGSVIGGTVTLAATAMANHQTRHLAKTAADTSAQERDQASAWRLMHTFQIIAGQINGANKMVRETLDANPDSPPDTWWRILMNPLQTGNEIAFQADDLALLIRLGRGGLITDLVDCEIDRRAVSTVLGAYGNQRREMLTMYRDQVAAGQTNTALLFLDPRFGELIGLAIEVEAVTKRAFSDVEKTAPALVKVMKAHFPNTPLRFGDPAPPEAELAA